jgi:hypothetical protein
MARNLLDSNVLIDDSKGVGAVVAQAPAWAAGGDEKAVIAGDNSEGADRGVTAKVLAGRIRPR